MMKIGIEKVKLPIKDNSGITIMLTEETIEERKNKLITLMRKEGYSSLIIYADKEHGSNFEYLTGFIPRFEEGLQVFNVDGSSTLILGNENYNKVKFSRVLSEGKKCSLLSLPNQPMKDLSELEAVIDSTYINASEKIGIVGWKMIPNMNKEFDVPSFIVNILENKFGIDKLFNGTHLYIDPNHGVRITNNANEIAHYEYGSSLASDSVLEALNSLHEGQTELEAGNYLTRDGQFPNVVTISAFGDRFKLANIYPTHNKLKVGDKVALTVSYRGGLSSRSGYAVNNEDELDKIDGEYITEVVKPYFKAYYFWLENMKIGMTGGEFYRVFSEIYPQNKYGWELCPGHLTSNEEWMSSPLYEGSEAKIKSGMIFQVDFIPIQPGHNGISAESTIALADEQLRAQIKNEYPELWERIQKRREYIKNELNIDLSDEVLPMTSTLGYYRPFMLNENYAVVKL